MFRFFERSPAASGGKFSISDFGFQIQSLSLLTSAATRREDARCGFELGSEIGLENSNGLGIEINRRKAPEPGPLHAEAETATAAKQVNEGKFTPQHKR
jgi:hypothetical protein